MPRLTEQEQQEIIRFLEADKPLPKKYRFLLFEDKREVELVWNGKTNEVSKDAHGIVTRQTLTQSWSDWIDYWAVDFNFESKRELIRVPKDTSLRAQTKQSPGVPQSPAEQETASSLAGTEADAVTGEYEEVWTGDFIFENEWQSFRTKKDRSLELKSAFHNCEPGRRKIAVKVVDIFGNDTMTIIDVSIGGKS